MSEHYLLISVVLIGAAMIPFYIRLERRPANTRELVLIASLAALAAASRVPFASLPSVQPTSFVIIVSAIVFGSEAGFLIGATAALVSNMFFGQGPWTPWQMFGWGMMGFTAGLLQRTFVMQRKWGRVVFGIVWGFIFGWIMNLTYVLGYLSEISWTTILATYAASFYFDLAHALCNAVFLLLFGAAWIRILRRYQVKYGLGDYK
ncbi:ECF transporter S component [Paenibacillus eucommiae]|uniref:ECF transporter S component n=1 Tax=Paenibacillus eucommiae TaxID=1355755 RepID=UPI0035E43934